jgi:hypothetical protein
MSLSHGISASKFLPYDSTEAVRNASKGALLDNSRGALQRPARAHIGCAQENRLVYRIFPAPHVFERGESQHGLSSMRQHKF